MLAMNITQNWGKFAQESGWNRAAGDPCTRFSSHEDLAVYDEFVSVDFDSCITKDRRCGRRRLEDAEIRALSEPPRSTSAEALSPKRRPRASTTNDLPLPVSPVSTLNPE